MSSTGSRDALKQLLRETMIRFPHMTFPPEFQKATLDDWGEVVRYIGLERFTIGVTEARKHGDFFPSLDSIAEHTPEKKLGVSERISRELRDLQRRKDAGEKFYTLGDVILEVCRRIEAGEIKGRDAETNQRLKAWAQRIGKDHKAYAEKMLAQSDPKRKKQVSA